MREDSVERLLGGAEGDKSTQKFTQNKNERTKVRSKNRRKKECDLTYYSVFCDDIKSKSYRESGITMYISFTRTT